MIRTSCILFCDEIHFLCHVNPIQLIFVNGCHKMHLADQSFTLVRPVVRPGFAGPMRQKAAWGSIDPKTWVSDVFFLPRRWVEKRLH